MLHLTTTVLILTVTVMLQGVVWFLVWLTQRHLFELRFIAAGFLTFAIGLLTLAFRSALTLPPAIIIIGQNYLIHIGMVLIAHGVARFLGQRGNPILMSACAVFTLIFWPVALLVDPHNVGIRILASNGLGLVMLISLIRTLLLDSSQPRALRWPLIAVFLSDLVALGVRSAIAIQHMDNPEALAGDALQAWYFFFFNIFITALFFMLLLMVGVRLSYGLRQKNDDLSREVAQRRELQEQLSASLATEKALHEEQKQLLRMVTHEFRTPLAIVDRAAEMIDVVLERPPETVSRRLGNIREAVQRLVQLIDRFLVAERRDFNILQAERIDIAGLLQRVQKHFAGMEIGARLQFSWQPALPFYWGDPEMLSTVLINLIDNALKYAPGDSKVDITARSEGNVIVIAVSDQGIGIPESEMALIGRRFFRASNTTPATGTGLGLYNTRRLLDYHNGLLSLRAGRNGGTVATVRLPLPGAVPGVGMEVA